MTTQSFALFGYPLGHTVSPFIHNELFKLNNISAEYSAIELPPDDITEAPQFIKEKLNGCNLTIPHKSSVIPLLDKLESRAELYGAVNTVNNKNGVLTGYNTDCVGFLRAINHAGIELKGRVLVCGAGGASRMMAFESAMADCRVTVAVRAGGKDKGEKLASEIKEKLGKDITVSLYDDLTADFDIVLNGTLWECTPKQTLAP